MWHLWCQVSGQWRYDMSGARALDYGPLFTLMDRLRLADADWQQMFSDIRTIERAALDRMHSK